MGGQTTTGEHAAVHAASVLEVRCQSIAAYLEADDPAGALDQLAWIEEEAAELVAALVYVARERGASWQYIGQLIGLERSSAHRRYAATTP